MDFLEEIVESRKHSPEFRAALGKRGHFCDIAGMRFGRYRVLSCAGKGKYGTYTWNCRCDCGVERVVDGGALRVGKTLSCGCFNADNKSEIAKRRREEGLSRGTGFRVLVNTYKRDAKRRGHKWALTEDLLAELTQKTCNYCGRPPSCVYRGHTKGSASWTYNGLDRVDNRGDYEPSNVVACCKTCNLMKGRLSRAEFLAAVALIQSHHVSPNL